MTSAIAVGSETIGDVKCDQYAMRQPGVDWQVWIRQGDQSLPCKLVITTTDDASMPEYSAVLTWRPNDQFAADTFDFQPPAGVQKIVMGQVAQASGRPK